MKRYNAYIRDPHDDRIVELAEIRAQNIVECVQLAVQGAMNDNGIQEPDAGEQIAVTVTLLED